MSLTGPLGSIQGQLAKRMIRERAVNLPKVESPPPSGRFKVPARGALFPHARPAAESAAESPAENLAKAENKVRNMTKKLSHVALMERAVNLPNLGSPINKKVFRPPPVSATAPVSAPAPVPAPAPTGRTWSEWFQGKRGGKRYKTRRRATTRKRKTRRNRK